MECERCGCECEYTQTEMWALCTEEPMHPDAPDCQACGCTCCDCRRRLRRRGGGCPCPVNTHDSLRKRSNGCARTARGRRPCIMAARRGCPISSPATAAGSSPSRSRSASAGRGPLQQVQLDRLKLAGALVDVIHSAADVGMIFAIAGRDEEETRERIEEPLEHQIAELQMYEAMAEALWCLCRK